MEMKKYLLCWALSFIVAFLFVAFTKAEIDPFQWEQDTRSGMLFLGCLLSCLSSIVYIGIKDIK